MCCAPCHHEAQIAKYNAWGAVFSHIHCRWKSWTETYRCRWRHQQPIERSCKSTEKESCVDCSMNNWCRRSTASRYRVRQGLTSWREVKSLYPKTWLLTFRQLTHPLLSWLLSMKSFGSERILGGGLISQKSWLSWIKHYTPKHLKSLGRTEIFMVTFSLDWGHSIVFAVTFWSLENDFKTVACAIFA